MPPWMQSPSRAILLITVSTLVGCLAFEYSEYGSGDPDRYFGTQPGYHRLSEFFAVDVRGRRMNFYFLEPSSGARNKLGVVQVYWYDRSDYGPREMAFAVSADGKRLLYFNTPGIEEGAPPATVDLVVVADLHLFDVETGVNEVVHKNVHRRSRASNCPELSGNYIAFGKVISISNIEPFVRSTEGQELALPVSPNAALEGADLARVCIGTVNG